MHFVCGVCLLLLLLGFRYRLMSSLVVSWGAAAAHLLIAIWYKLF